MVVQVLADAGEVDGDLQPDPRQHGGRPDAGEHQQLRRLDRACAEHDLLFGAHLSPADVDPDAPAALEDEPADAGPGQHGQVRRVQHRPQEATVWLWRTLSLTVKWQYPTPSWVGPLWSSLNGTPTSCAASTHAAAKGGARSRRSRAAARRRRGTRTRRG